MCNIKTKMADIYDIAYGIKPKQYVKDNEKRYQLEHDKYNHIKNEINSCKTSDEKVNLEILFKCDYEEVVNKLKALDLMQHIGVMFTIAVAIVSTLLNIISDNKAMSLFEISENIFITYLIITFVFGTGLFFGFWHEVVTIKKRSKLLYILEIFKTINKE